MNLPSLEVAPTLKAEPLYRAGYKWGLVDAASVIVAQMRCAETREEARSLRALMEAIYRMGEA